MPELWIATTNAAKHRELERLLRPLGVAVRGAGDATGGFAVVEDRPDFAGNARRKAEALARLTGAVAMGEDSGLSVDALGGRPGVRSARYAGPGATDADRIRKLLTELAGVAPGDRAARFTCSICLCGPDGTVRASLEEHCEGVILDAPRGEGGFGYDPVFVAVEHLDRSPSPSFAQLTPDQKDRVSHRGKALRRLVELLENDPGILTP